VTVRSVSPPRNRRSKRTRFLALPVVGVALLAASAGCTARAGAAAIVGSDRIETSTLKDATLTGSNATSLQTYGGLEGLQQHELTILIGRDLVASLARQQGVSVTSGEVGVLRQQFVTQAGSEKAFVDQVAQSGIAGKDLAAALYDETLREKLIAHFSAVEATGESKYGAALQGEAARIGVHVNPRFGMWDQANLAVVAAPNKLATPAKTSSSS
jgi:hypothetical protein